jgi:hypothetical protein
MAIGLITTQDSSRREDLIDIVTNISPSETPLLTGLPMGQAAKQTLHEYTVDTYASAADDAAAEASGFTAVDLTQPTRANNVTQIFKEDILVSETEIAVAGVVEPYNYQIQKNMVQHAKNIELAFMAGSRNSGNSGLARRLAGVINSISTNLSTRNSGSSLGQKDFDDMMQLIWSGAAGTGTGYVATEIYTGAQLRRDISGFTTSVTRFIAQDDKKLVNPVDVYESNFGLHKIFLHRNVPSGANALALVAINPQFFRKSYLRPTHLLPLAPDGDRRRGSVITEVTLESRAENSSLFFGGFTS